jgi:hypothetical protein
MTFRYTPGDCSQSFNIQPSDKFSCTDLNEGPPTEEGVESYIVAFRLGGGDSFFEGFVTTGELWTLRTENGDKVSADMNITVYDPRGSTDPNEIKQPANMLQTVNYHSSCSRNLFLKDRFGNNQIVEWTSETIGLVTCFIETGLEISVEIPIDSQGTRTIELKEFTTLHNYEPFVFNRTDEANGVILGPGDSFTPTPFQIDIDLTVRKRYTFFTTIVGQDVNTGQECNGDDFLEFTAGNPLPPIFPTVAPSQSPTSSPYPTPDPETTPCGLEAEVRCSVIEGASTSCRSLSVPDVRTTCILTGNNAPNVGLEELVFQYTGANCQANRPDCRNENGGVNGLEEVWMEIKDRDGNYIEQVVQLNGFIKVENPTGFRQDRLDIEIYEYDPTDKDNRGARLQRERINPSCVVNELELGRDYGASKLTSFTDEANGQQSLFATVEVSYFIQNDSVFPAILESGIVSSFFSGPNQQKVRQEQQIRRFDTVSIFREEQILDLEEASQSPLGFIFGLVIEGRVDNALETECQDTAAFNFVVAP